MSFNYHIAQQGDYKMINNNEKIQIDVNGKEVSVESQRVSYEDVLRLSGTQTVKKNNFVMFFDADSSPTRGLLSKGHDVIVSRVLPTRFQVVQN